ncbi:hypothetical protein B0H15DRAFT_877687 [Mycena belliarum]|uniref:NADH dehydrogenase [ubiquinone] 1 alpha subcomplex subunit n=1 Tax=Mycena belliarum TaxID=1033014 RepID=A0AAD6XW83_9AGAR|nr:hypothetical protein B0H15DRAFT_877687 [Mycena belliae]
MSFLRRIVHRFRRPNYFVGQDLEGNSYYEHPSVLDDPRPKRTVKYKGAGDMWTYVGGQRRLAVQWSSWLTHTRSDPPTFEELQADLLRQERVRRNVALLEARDREEDRLRVAASTAPPLTLRVPSLPSDPPAEPPAEPAPMAKAFPDTPSSPPSAETEAWTPHAAVRGQ